MAAVVAVVDCVVDGAPMVGNVVAGVLNGVHLDRRRWSEQTANSIETNLKNKIIEYKCVFLLHKD